MASIIPDIDLLIPGLEHRGPAHSLIIFSLLFLSVFLLYGKRGTPYVIALAQHSIIGDYLTRGGVQLFWPVSLCWYSVGIPVTSLANILIEWMLFLTSLSIMLKTKDIWTLLGRHPSNMLLAIPIFTVLLPSFFNFPLSVPLLLIIPHLTYLTIFTFSILVDLKVIFTHSNN